MSRISTISLLYELLDAIKENKKWIFLMGIVGIALAALVFGEFVNILGCSVPSSPACQNWTLIFINPMYHVDFILLSCASGFCGVKLLRLGTKLQKKCVDLPAIDIEDEFSQEFSGGS